MMDKLSIEKIQRMIEYKQEQIDAVVLGGHIFSAMEKGGLKAEKQAFEELLQLRAQPDNPALIRCKDCDLWNDWDSVGNERISNLRCSCAQWSSEDGYTVYTAPVDYCSYAEPKIDVADRPKEDNHG